jgi:serine protease
VDVIEFHNSDLNHYFLTANAQEAQQIDAGGAGPGWTRTNRSFKGYQGIQGSPLSSHTVCRFYGTPGRGPNSHFYTAFASECAGVQQDPGWRLEDPEAFAIFVPNAVTSCDHPVYRAYNNRAAFNDSNHRYMTERSDYDAMVAAGWTGEGQVFCTFR